MTRSERSAAIAALYHGEEPTLSLLAKATGRTLNGLEAASRREGWANVAQKPRRLTNEQKAHELLRRVEQVIDDKLQKGLAIKGDVDEVLNLLKLVEKLSGTGSQLSQQNTLEKTANNEGDAIAETANIRSILRKIDDRIQDLAERRAEALLNEQQGKFQPNE